MRNAQPTLFKIKRNLKQSPWIQEQDNDVYYLCSFFNILFEALVGAIEQENKIKWIQIGKQ